MQHSLKPGFHSNAIACVNENRKKHKRLRWQAANHGCHCFDWAFLLAGACVCCVNASACVSCGFRLRNASDCVWMETGLNCRLLIAAFSVHISQPREPRRGRLTRLRTHCHIWTLIICNWVNHNQDFSTEVKLRLLLVIARVRRFLNSDEKLPA